MKLNQCGEFLGSKTIIIPGLSGNETRHLRKTLGFAPVTEPEDVTKKGKKVMHLDVANGTEIKMHIYYQSEEIYKDILLMASRSAETQRLTWEKILLNVKNMKLTVEDIFGLFASM